MITLSLTEQEAVALRQMIDAAVRGHGLRAAEAGLLLDAKIAKAMEAVKVGNGSGAPDGSRAGATSSA